MLRTALLASLLAIGLACSPSRDTPTSDAGTSAPLPQPTTIKEFGPWFWLHYADASDADLSAAATAFLALPAVMEVGATHEYTGTGPASMTVAGSNLVRAGQDPTALPQLILVDELSCSLAEIEALLIRTDQKSVHATYDTFTRSYTTSLSEFSSQSRATIEWTQTGVRESLSLTHGGGVRRGPAGVLLERQWLAEPVAFSDSQQYFRQDYLVGAYFERSPGKTVHLLGEWKEIRQKVLDQYFGQNDELYQSVLLSNLIDWDKELASKCGNGT